jgi:hypothetical protein
MLLMKSISHGVPVGTPAQAYYLVMEEHFLCLLVQNCDKALGNIPL